MIYNTLKIFLPPISDYAEGTAWIQSVAFTGGEIKDIYLALEISFKITALTSTGV